MQLKKLWPLGLVLVIVSGYWVKQFTTACWAEYRDWKQQFTEAITNFKEVSDDASKAFDQISAMIEKLTDRVEGLEQREASKTEWSRQAIDQVLKQAKTTAPSGQTKTPPKGK